MNKSKCPFCKKEFSDILKHFVLAHGIRDMNNLEEEIEKAEKKEEAKIKFRNYVEDLKKKMKEGVISPENYRELIMKWCEEQK